MSARLTCHARELTDDSYIYHHGYNEIRHVAKAHTVDDRTYLIYAAGVPGDFEADGVVALATEAEILAYRLEQDRFAVARALSRLGSQIVDRELPVPAGGVGIVVSFDLADDSDLEPWSRWLSKRPQRGTSRPHIQAEAEGVEVYVYGPGTSGEFGPDLADATQTEPDVLAQNMAILRDHSLCAPDVEHGDSVGAFPVVASSPWTGCGRCGAATTPGRELCTGCKVYLATKAAEEEKPERDGFAPPSGHAAVLPPDALKHDRYNGENEA